VHGSVTRRVGGIEISAHVSKITKKSREKNIRVAPCFFLFCQNPTPPITH
jgi:hypothetical protein